MTGRAPVYLKDWGDLDQEPVRKGVHRSGFGTDEVLLVRNVLERGMDLNPHVHDFDQIALIVAGHATMHLDDETCDMPAGSVVLIPAGVHHYAEPVGDEPVVNIDVFAPVRADLAHLAAWMGSDATA
jgi:quercetin dioxygenase-like cupin family protein